MFGSCNFDECLQEGKKTCPYFVITIRRITPRSAVQNATTITHFIVTAKIKMDIRNISAETAIINLHPNARGRRGQIVSGNIRPVPFAVKPASSTTTTSITATTAAATKSATTHSLCGNPLPLQTLPCLSFLENMILSVCAILRRLSSQLYPCFT